MKSVWATEYGEIILYKTSEGLVRGTYTYKDSEIRGVIVDNALHGTWRQVEEGVVACSTEIEGSPYWGRLVFFFNSDLSAFEGKWGYCSGTALDGKWDGERRN